MLMNRLNDFIFSSDADSIDHMIACYMKNHFNVIHTMTIDEIANGCFVSKAKISSFCKKLGYENFIAFKDECARDTKEKGSVVLHIEENSAITFQDHIRMSMGKIENGLTHIDPKIIDTLAYQIHQVEYIYAYGTGYSNLLCRYFQYDCDFLDKKVIILDEKLHKEVPIQKESILLVFSVDGSCFKFDTRLTGKLMKYPFQKWIITTDTIQKDLLTLFGNSLVIPSDQADMKDRRILLRYFIDILIGRYHFLYK